MWDGVGAAAYLNSKLPKSKAVPKQEARRLPEPGISQLGADCRWARLEGHSPAAIQHAIWEGCSLSWNLPLPPKLFSYDDPTRPSHWQPGKPAVYVNLLLIILGFLVVIFSIWGYHQLK